MNKSKCNNEYAMKEEYENRIVQNKLETCDVGSTLICFSWLKTAFIFQSALFLAPLFTYLGLHLAIRTKSDISGYT